MEKILEIIRPWLKDLIKEAIKEVLDESEPKEGTQKQLENLCTRDEACKYLQICHATFHNWANAGKLPVVKIQGRTYVDQSIVKQLNQHKNV